MSNSVWLRTCQAFLAVILILFMGGCANDRRPADHAEFAEKWINAVSHADGQGLNCKIAKDWYAPGRVQDTCQKLFEHVEVSYLGTLTYLRAEGGSSDASTLKDVMFECVVAEGAGTPQDLESSGLKLPVNCLDRDGLGVKVALDRFTGPPEVWQIYQVEGHTKFWD